MTNSRIDAIGRKSAEFRTQHDKVIEHRADVDRRSHDTRIKLSDLSLKMMISPNSVFRHQREKKRTRLNSEQLALMNEWSAGSNAQFELAVAASNHYRKNPVDYYNDALLDATNAGVEIATQDPDAIEKALWQHANIAEGQDNLYPIEHLALNNITTAELDRNLQTYPEMQEEFTNAELESARTFLLRVPLTHVTRNYTEYSQSTSDGIKPMNLRSHASLSKDGSIDTTFSGEGLTGFSSELDYIMGLDQYVFMCMGTIYHHGSPGDTDLATILVDPNILMDEKCIVTPDDISNVAKEAFGTAAIEWQTHIDDVEKYRSSVVSGAGWLELTSRRVAKFHRQNPDAPFPVDSIFTLGEVKYRDEVPADFIIGVLTTATDTDQYLEELSKTLALWPSDKAQQSVIPNNIQ